VVEHGDGAYVTTHAHDADVLGAVPMYTLYQMADWGDDGPTELNALNTTSFMKMYWRSARLMFGLLGSYGKPALVNLEPDFWGYCQTYFKMTGKSPTEIPAYVQDETDNPDCTSLPNNLTGMALCLVQLRNKYATNALLGFAPSLWGNTAQATADFMNAVIDHTKYDFVIVQTLDRDAGCLESGVDCSRAGSGWYWSDSDYTNAFNSATTLHTVIGLPLLWWQTPLGVAKSTSGGTTKHYRDNRVLTFFSSPSRLVQAGAFGMVFGAGDLNQTNITTDQGQFWQATLSYYATPASLP
jgi:hypothetical protein